MKYFPFELQDEDSLITINSTIDNQSIRLALDTGASHTVIDLTALILAGYSLDKIVGTVELETAKGSVDAYLYEVKKFSALGIIKKNMTICSYDFLMNGVLVDIDGVLGLDFLLGYKICIDLQDFNIAIH